MLRPFGRTPSQPNDGAGGSSVPAPEKRLSPRLAGPFTATLLIGFSVVPNQVQVRDINEQGLFFWSDEPLGVGGSVSIEMDLPPGMADKERERVRYQVSIVRSEELGGKHGLAATIRSCTVLAK
jgi:hypothetical protein